MSHDNDSLEMPPDEAPRFGPKLEAELQHALDLIESELRKLKKLQKVREADVAKHEKALTQKIFGDLIKQNFATIERGMSEAILRGFDEMGGEVEVTVPLNPRLTPKENMQEHFKAFQKGVKGVAKAGAKLAETIDSFVTLTALHAELEVAAEVAEEADLLALLNHSAIRHLLTQERRDAITRQGKNAKRAPKGPYDDLPTTLRPRIFTSLEGWTVLCGRGARGNDWLTTRIANGNDWFFHIAGFPGAHVILRNQRGQNPPLDTMLDCAQLCLYFSKMKNAQSASVHYVQCKFVRKPKGAKPGMVLVHGGKELSVRRDPARLTRLFGRPME